MAAATVSAAGHRWAAAEDWDIHRRTITEMYETENMKLQDVMKIMEREHNFYATYGRPCLLLSRPSRFLSRPHPFSPFPSSADNAPLKPGST
jgi:hypothetical protein